MRLATISESKEIDELSSSVYKLSGEILMEIAGSLAAREVDQSFYPELKSGTIGILCGAGNNGGDGLVMARHLYSMGYKNILIFIFADRSRRSSLFSLQLERVNLQGLKVVDLNENWGKKDQIKSCGLVVDGLLGVGLNRTLEDKYLELVDLLNATKSPVVSLDVPSGLDANKGIILGSCVRSQMTITFGLAKPGFFISEGPLNVGRVRVLPIGIPLEVMRGVAVSHFCFGEKLARRYLPKRKETSNKSDHGRLLVLAGSEGCWGAATLCAMSAYRMGTGYVTLASFTDPSFLSKETPEFLTTVIDDKIWQSFNYDAVCVGPGLGVGQRTADVIKKLKEQKIDKVILDADALTTCSEFNLFPLPMSWVITPHAGELSKIIGVEAKTIESDRFKFVREATEKTQGHVLLKGFRSIVSYKDRSMVINAGNAALAKAGTGDVLSGMIGGLMAQGLPTLQSTATGAYIHGRIADEWVRSGRDKRTLVASDLSEQLPQLVSRIAKGTLL